MNQFVTITTRNAVDLKPVENAKVRISVKFGFQLRQLAAKFKMHYAILHRLGPANASLAEATLVGNVRGLANSNWQICDLMSQQTINALKAGLSPVIWQRSADNSDLDPLHRLNISAGVSIPFHNAYGNHVALTLCDIAITMPEEEIVGHAKNAAPFIESVLAEYRAKNTMEFSLTPRETDCLQWAAAGKTSLETGIILGLSPHTVNQHLSRTTEKLGGVNRTHAVIKAARLGLIDLSNA